MDQATAEDAETMTRLLALLLGALAGLALAVAICGIGGIR